MSESEVLMNRTESIVHLRELVHQAKHAVFFGGAGVSTASGIPDFRGSGRGEEPVEYLLSRDCLRREPERFFAHYRRRMVYPDAAPNAAHRALAALEAEGHLKAVITQNIDGLHQKAGSRRVLELHGNGTRYYCDRCGARYPVLPVGDGVFRCDKTACRGLVRPDIVLYGEGLNAAVWEQAVAEVAAADLLLVGGSSLVVHPAASLLDYFAGEHLILINFQPTPYDTKAETVLRESLTDVLPLLR